MTALRLSHGGAMLALTASLTGTLVAGCSVPEFLRTHKYPAFDQGRVERVDEPVSVVTTNVHHIRVGTLRDGRSVQWMPLEVVLRSQSNFDWSKLREHVIVAEEARGTHQHGPNTTRQIYLLPETFVPDTVNVKRPKEERSAPRLGETTPLSVPPGPYDDSLKAQERRFLGELDAGEDARKRWHTRLTMVCLTAQTGDASATSLPRCFYSGRRYSLVLGDTLDRTHVPAEYPFRVENRNGPLGFVSGIALISAFVAAEVVKWGP